MNKWIVLLALPLICGLVSAQDIGEIIKSEGPESCNTPGRYQFYIHPTIRTDQYLVDTCLGRVWQQINYTDINKTVWKRVPRVDTDKELSNWQYQEVTKSRANQ